MYKIEKENLEALFRKIAESQDLILPVKKAGQTNFGLWNEEEEADLDTLKTVKSGKDAFFPQSETLYTVVRDGKKLTVEPEELRNRPFVVFGMKACDVKGVAVLDKVFLADPVDTFYGEYQAGADAESKGPLTSFTFEDVEPGVVAERG